jgi:alkylation response protein AidB-like acyl-CoA dehydrogenase
MAVKAAKGTSPMSDLDKFGAKTRAWLGANCPSDMRLPLEDDDDRYWGGRDAKFKSEGQRLWFERMLARGWTVPEWPKEYGGGGLSREEGKILRGEMRRLGCRSPLDSFGIWMLGPALLRYGTEAQKREYLPQIARGEIRWCQGYSEPNSGSDLASLATRAKGDHFLVTGQKVWTSYADKADWIFCLVRTDPAAPKHLGISFVLFDMMTPGVSTRPILVISGMSPFCETFFDNAHVPKGNVVGELNKGWEVAKYLLTHEREMISAIGLTAGRPLGQIAAESVGTEAGILADTCLRADIARFEVDAFAFRLALERTGDLLKAKQANPAISSMLKYYGAELNKRRYELLMSAGGSAALERESERSRRGEAARSWLRTKANSIEGGTSEVQLNVIAKRILELPGA